MVSFNLPPNTNFGFVSLCNAAQVQVLQLIIVPGEEVYVFEQLGTESVLMPGPTAFKSADDGVVSVYIHSNGKEEPIRYQQSIIPGTNVNYIVLGAEDSSDQDFNDVIAMIYWPIG